ncbi:hypothetical protein [Bradyrhizobium canariense]|nr:hypothetical protein [Bradyrhizobium canariense]OSJ12255.1 hypothetical protein BSR47_24260 [Bradyrhizobium canariense]
MAVEDLEQFKEWDLASTKVATWQMIFDKTKKDYPESHVLYQHAKTQLEKAEAHLADIQGKW